MTRPNIVLVVMDAMRLDSSNSIRTALPEFVSYDNAVSAAPWTLPSHVSMFTGLYPSQHGSHETEEIKCTDIGQIRNKRTTVADKLKDLGYRTYGISGNILVSPTYGFDFDTFELVSSSFPWPQLLEYLTPTEAKLFRKFLDTKKVVDGASFLFNLLGHDLRRVGRVLHMLTQKMVRNMTDGPKEKGGNQAIEFIAKTKLKEPFFMFINLMEAHEPYFRSDNLLTGLTPRHVDSIDSRNLRKWVSGYHSQSVVMRDTLIRLVDALDQKGLLERTVMVITSDHGQLLGENGWIGHGSFLFDELVRVPLLIRYPKSHDVALSARHGVISLTNLPRFFLDLVKGGRTDSQLYGSVAFAESWGLYENVPSRKQFMASKYESINKRRICVVQESSKLTYNLTDNQVEELVCHKNMTNTDIEKLIEECWGLAGTGPLRREAPKLNTDSEQDVIERLRRLGYI